MFEKKKTKTSKKPIAFLFYANFAHYFIYCSLLTRRFLKFPSTHKLFSFNNLNADPCRTGGNCLQSTTKILHIFRFFGVFAFENHDFHSNSNTWGIGKLLSNLLTSFRVDKSEQKSLRKNGFFKISMGLFIWWESGTYINIF